jgi:hypothetical protein
MIPANQFTRFHGKSAWQAIFLQAAFTVLLLAPIMTTAADRVHFNRDIRPILTEKCTYCHGPDANHRKADLRLDVREDAITAGAIVPGDAAKSELIARILTSDADDLMPPPDSHKKLTPAEKDLLQRWVAEGADYQGHWAFEKPVRPAVPETPDARASVRNAIDSFVLTRLQEEKLGFSPRADPRSLARRLSLDLTGLPPAPEVVEAFAADPSDAAYEALVDRLLQAPAYGEHMASQWLDCARYADSHGFQIDSSRNMWPWRDWVIRAFNENQPFDQFTIDQLAGDLLPNPRLDQIVATGFHRNHRLNGEGGSIEEEWHIENVIDRVDTTGATWMGLTLACARCHDHKYDPISQREFFQMFAFFNNIDESGIMRDTRRTRGGNPDPSIKLPTVEQQRELARLHDTVVKSEAAVRAAEKQLPALLSAWEPGFQLDLAQSKPQWQPLEPAKVSSVHGTTFTRQKDGTWLAGGPTPEHETYLIQAPVATSLLSGLRLDIQPDPSLPAGSVGRNDYGNFVLTQIEAEITAPSLEHPLVLTFTEVEADYSQKGWGIESLVPADLTKNAKRTSTKGGNRGQGWAVDGNTRREPNRALFLTSSPIPVPPDATLTVRLVHTTLGKHQIGRFKINLTQAPPETVTLDGDGAAPQDIRAILALAPDQRDAKQKARLTAFYRAGFDSPVKRADTALASARKRHTQFEASLPDVMVMKELPEPRTAHILIRGQYDKPGDAVTAATPAILPPLPDGAKRDRLALARWLVSPEHPLTARVWVNRQWERFFGLGLVKSSENLGVQSDPPSHPELLDWLATEFMGSGWNMKHLQKLIVMSATYRQTASRTHLPSGLPAQDPENRLLARGPRQRLSAEVIRDQALAISGLLDPKIGGPSVRPYMPQGVWDETSVYGDLRNYKPDVERGLYRRTLYTIWKRTAAPPTMLLFDSPSRETCTVKRARTNTPLQALALLNEVTYLEAARVFAQRMIQHGGTAPAERITWAFRQALSRPPDTRELTILTAGLQRHLARYQTAPAEASALLATGHAPLPPDLDPALLAAYTVTANVVLNLDELLNKE